MNFLLIFWYSAIDDYCFYDGRGFYEIYKGSKQPLLYSPNMELICEIYDIPIWNKR